MIERRALFLLSVPIACTPFAAVKPATVEPGVQVTFQVALTSPPGEEVGWFYSFDCAFDCNHAIFAPDIGVHLAADGDTDLPFQIGGGIAGTYAYAELYKQMGNAPGRPWGLGGRVGVPLMDWTEHRLYARFERPAGGGSLILNPTLYLLTGNSPNGQNPGSFLAFVQGIGFADRNDHTTIVPAIAAGIGRGWRSSYGQELGPFNAIFATASLSITVHRQRAR